MADPLASELGLEIVRIRSHGRQAAIAANYDRKSGRRTDRRRGLRNLLPQPFARPRSRRSNHVKLIALEVSTPGIDRPFDPGRGFRALGWTFGQNRTDHAASRSPPLSRHVIQPRRRERVWRLSLMMRASSSRKVHEMSKASLILTDELIDAAANRRRHSAPTAGR